MVDRQSGPTACLNVLHAFLLALPLSAFCADTPCVDSSMSKRVSVEHVIDGDTLALAGGARVRIVGINASELTDQNDRAQPFARASRNLVTNLIRQSHNRILVVPARAVAALSDQPLAVSTLTLR